MSGLIPQRFVEDLLERIDLAELIGSRVTLKKAGTSYKARCPFHDEKTPSFNVRPDKGFYHCFGCGAHGDAISFVRELDGLGFTEAVEELARRAGLEVPYDQQARQEIQQAKTLTDALNFATGFYQKSLSSERGQFARDYLNQRGLSEDIIQRYALGYAPGTGTALYDAAGEDIRPQLIETGAVSDKFGRPRDLLRNRVIFPIRNARGRTIAFGGRTLGDDKAKYINSPESSVFHKSREIYGLYEAKQALRSIDKLVVVEGYMDVIALAQHGIDYAVATLGTATNQESLSALLKQTRHLVFCFDGDAAGYRAADRALENALELLNDGIHMQFLMLPEGEDPDTLVRAEGPDAFEKRIAGATPFSRYLFERHAEDIDLSLPEGRGEFSARIEPLLNRMPHGTLRNAMWAELGTLLKANTRRGTDYTASRPSSPAGQQRAQMRLSKDSWLCLALLESPELCAETIQLASASRQFPQSLAFARWIENSGARTRGDILRELATDQVARKRFEGLFDGIEHMPDRAQILETARGVLSPDREQSRKQRLAALLANKKSLADLTPEQRSELKDLGNYTDS